MNYFLNYFNSIQPQRFFLVTASVFGLLFLFLTPPLQVPDEPLHFYRVWHISEGHLTAIKKDQRIGGYMPLSLEKMEHPFWLVIFPGLKVNFDTLVNVSKIKQNASVKKFKDFNNTALSSPVCYFPQAAATFVLRVFNLPPLFIFYGARLCALFFWIFMIYTSIKIIPVYKWLFTFLALLPMSLFVNMSLSADVTTNAVSFLFIALCLKYTYDEVPINYKRFLLLCLFMVLIASLKSIYGALILILFILPHEKFGKRKDYYLKMGFLFCLALFTAMFWASVLKTSYLNYADYNPQYRDDLSLIKDADVSDQLHFILHNGFYIFKVLFDSVLFSFDMYFTGYVGTFGWLDVKLPLWLVYCAYLVIILLSIVDGNAKIKIKPTHKFIFGFTFFALFILVFLSQHLAWDVVGSALITNIQGRYLIPFTPLLFLLPSSRKDYLKKGFIPFVIIFTVLTLSYSLFLIYGRYFGAQ